VLIPTALFSLLLLVGAAPDAHRAPDTEIQKPVSPGDRLEISNLAGTIRVRPGVDAVVRISARHLAADAILVEREGGILRVRSRLWKQGAEQFRISPVPDGQRAVIRTGPEGVKPIAYEVTAPPWLSLHLEGPYTNIDVEGIAADVQARVVTGNIRVDGARGVLSLLSLGGAIEVVRSEGRIKATAGRGRTVLRDCTGFVSVEGAAGAVELIDVRARDLEVSTVGGQVSFDGSVAASTYVAIDTHDGDILFAVPVDSDASFRAASIKGRIESALLASSAANYEHELTFTLGQGQGVVDLQSFKGTIRLRPAAPRPPH